MVTSGGTSKAVASAELTLSQQDAAQLTIHGRLTAASNGSFLASLPDSRSVIYKPMRGERPLWDFPAGTLGRREVAAYEVSRAMGLTIVPPTIWIDTAPLGPGSLQLWVESLEGEPILVDLVPGSQSCEGFLTSFVGVDAHNNEVQLVHADDPGLAMVAVFDAVVNNADRKAGHLIVHDQGVAAIDHGVCFHIEPKLRTVLWGWAGRVIPDEARQALLRIADVNHPLYGTIAELLSDEEAQATADRVHHLLAAERFPEPSEEWPALPWPLW